MTRPKRPECRTAQEARKELQGPPSRPGWLAHDHSLPFGSLGPIEFEVLSFLLLLNERHGTGAEVTLFGKTGDSGRDIIVSEAHSVELVQCKHYQDSVGIGPVGRELAKLFTNAFHQVIRKADKVTFYVSTDLTPQAIDLLANQDGWCQRAPKALADFLGESPANDLLNFSLTWWPSFRHVSGVELTQRIRAYPELVNEFFSLRPIITGDVAEVTKALDVGLGAVQDKLDLLLSVQTHSPTQALAKLLATAESANPGLSFSAEVTGSGDMQYRVAVKRGHGPVAVGTLRFFGAPNGAIGAAKLKQAMEEGRAVELAEGEFQWTPSFVVPDRQVGKTTSLAIHPVLPAVRAPVRIELVRGGEVQVAIDLAYLAAKRLGLREMELELSGGHLAGSISVVLKHAGGTDHTIAVVLDLGSVHASRAVKTVRLLEGLQAEGGTLRVTSLDMEAPLFVLEGMSALPLGPLEHTRELLMDIGTISAECGLDIRFPSGVPCTDDARTAELLAAGIRHGRVSLRIPNDLFLAQVSEEASVTLREAVAKKAACVSFGPVDGTFQLFGHTVAAGPITTHLNDPVLVDASPAISPSSVGSAAVYDVAIRCSAVIHEFHRWTKPTAPLNRSE